MSTHQLSRRQVCAAAGSVLLLRAAPAAAQHLGESTILYGIEPNGNLYRYRHLGRADGSLRWTDGNGRNVGNGWNRFVKVFSGGDGVIYGIEPNGNLYWYRHLGRADGSLRWTDGNGRNVGNGWNRFVQVFSGGDGVIYGIEPSGDLYWYRHLGRADGSLRWTDGNGRNVGNGWNRFVKVFSGGDGVIYGIEPNGNLYWYRHLGRADGSLRWTDGNGRNVGNGWNRFVTVVSAAGDGVIYGIEPNGDLYWYRHLGRADGSLRWTDGNRPQRRQRLEPLFGSAGGLSESGSGNRPAVTSWRPARRLNMQFD